MSPAQCVVSVRHIEDVVMAPHSPCQNPFVERFIGSIRRECFDHVIVLNERHLKCILRLKVAYYHKSRTPFSFDRNAPMVRAVEPPGRGKVISIAQVGGLHRRYCRAARATVSRFTSLTRSRQPVRALVGNQ
jgi:putative transposase